MMDFRSEFEKRTEMMADLIKKSGNSTLHFFPLRKSERAFSNMTRRMVLGYLLGYKDATRRYPEDNPPKRIRESLEKAATAKGYTIIEVDAGDYQ